MDLSWEKSFLIALLITISTETAVLFLCSRWLIPGKPSVGLRVFAGVTASALTLPYLWFVWPWTGLSFKSYAFTGELAVTLAEAVFYLFVLRISFSRACMLSVCCNAVSFAAGWLLN